MGFDPRGYYRARAERGKDRASGISRPAHRPAEPGGVQRAHRKCLARRGRQCLVCRAVRRHRSVQGDQRRLRPFDRRQVSGGGRPQADVGLQRIVPGAARADEFIVVSPDGPQPAMARDLCAQLGTALDQPVCIEGHAIEGSLTIGASIYPRDGADADTLVANAETALYRVKADQRGSTRFFEPEMGRQMREKRALQHDIRAALAKNELELYYQPQALPNGRVFGFEALLHWRHPLRGLVPPGLFIPLAEETGAIGPIDEWVLREACREAASWRRPLTIAVNLSTVDFRRSDVPAMILATLLETGLDPQRLEVEITEGVLFWDFDRALSILRRIKGFGVRIAMDDFGTGYSSLSYPQDFPFDKIKIDQTFVSRIGDSFQAGAIIQSIVRLGRTLALPVIAEGVETEEQRTFLAREGCQVQGYLIGRPEPIAHYRHLIAGLATARESAIRAR
ncbi:putative bifunctional diguanylate cyclase/phosphodiesterase [Bradyrhizobium sp. AZCC 1588]|uniref:putative bifunctional diguanylate cyclase/phosphodiesterase n=1 Tax=Bradyrhizobium sp. AZCC 1588 TaxID=3117018 RepID=UPI003FA52A52